MFVEVDYDSGPPDQYFMPLMMRDGVLQDALRDDASCRAMLKLNELSTMQGKISGQAGREVMDSASSLAVRRVSSEQSNSSVIYGDSFILKLFRRQQPGENPEIEIGRYLTEIARFDRVPAFLGWIEYCKKSGESSALAMIQALIPNEGDGWTWMTEELERYYEGCACIALPETQEARRDHVGAFLETAAVLGRRTAELHLALAAETDAPAFAPEPFDAGEVEAMAAQMCNEAMEALDLLKASLATLPDEILAMAGITLGRRHQMIDRLRLKAQGHDYGKRIRTHGDYHLGQVLRTRNDFVIIDFEGEPARPLAQRRAKYSPLKDVAGMLRSLSYAANSTLLTYTARHPDDFPSLERWARLWGPTVSAQILSTYRDIIGAGNILPFEEKDFRNFLDACLLEKALYELRYELNNRPTWVRIPLAGILSLTG
jgi:maltose alpha-D-glucosyltransferase / alpha-amylase